jgi:hypothetical protein
VNVKEMLKILRVTRGSEGKSWASCGRKEGLPMGGTNRSVLGRGKTILTTRDRYLFLVLIINYNILLKDMMNSAQNTATPLTSEQESLFYDEMDKMEQKFGKLLEGLGIDLDDLPNLVEMANLMRYP